jgi:hypothetical protein
MKSRREIYNETVESGTPPPMMSAEGEAEARRLGAGLSFQNASKRQAPMRKKPQSAPGNDPYSKNYGPQNAFAIESDAGKRNAQRAGAVVDWRNTKISATQGALDSDPWTMLGLRFRGSDIEGEMRQFERVIMRPLATEKRRGLSYGRDAALERIDLGRLVGLRFYLDGLGEDEPIDPKIVLPLLEGISRRK